MHSHEKTPQHSGSHAREKRHSVKDSRTPIVSITGGNPSSRIQEEDRTSHSTKSAKNLRETRSVRSQFVGPSQRWSYETNNKQAFGWFGRFFPTRARQLSETSLCSMLYAKKTVIDSLQRSEKPNNWAIPLHLFYLLVNRDVYALL